MLVFFFFQTAPLSTLQALTPSRALLSVWKKCTFDESVFVLAVIFL